MGRRTLRLAAACLAGLAAAWATSAGARAATEASPGSGAARRAAAGTSEGRRARDAAAHPPIADSSDYLTLNVGISERGVDPAEVFVPAGRPVQLMLRNRGTVEHHYHVVGLAPHELVWVTRGEDDGAAPRVSTDLDDHSAHHARQVTRARDASPGGIRPSGREVHAYVVAHGDVDRVLFVAHQTGTFEVRCDLHAETLGTITVFDPADPDDGTSGGAGGGSADRLARTLRQSLGTVDLPGAPGVQMDATYATGEFAARVLGGSAVAAAMRLDEHVSFLVTERTHRERLTERPVPPELRIDGRLVPLVDVTVMTDSAHHRATLVRYTRDASFGFGGHQTMTLRMPIDLCGGTGREATWHLPIIAAPVLAAGAAGGMLDQWALVFAVLGGMVAAMWPCLFQLTVYFIPALAGVAMQEVDDGSARGRRRRVVSAAFYFILGFTLVYTATGALIGYAAERLGESGQFETVQRYIGVVAGLVVIGLALRSAAKVRAPLVCRMPVLSGISRSSQPATRVEMMLAGLAFATGCMTCFGSALVVGMVVYVGMAQSALYGALILFLFSLGMAVPLVAAALAMARALPLLMKLDTAMPWMGLASATLMGGFGVLLVTGHYMLVSEWMYRLVNGSASVQAPLAAGAAATLGVALLAWLAWKRRAAGRVGVVTAET